MRNLFITAIVAMTCFYSLAASASGCWPVSCEDEEGSGSPPASCSLVAEEAVKGAAIAPGVVLGRSANCRPASKDEVSIQPAIRIDEKTYQVFARLLRSCGSEWRVVIEPTTCMVKRVENMQME